MNKEVIVKRYFTLCLLLLISIKLQTIPGIYYNKNIPYYEYCYFELVRREGIQLNTYICPAGNKTIGIGQRTNSNKNITLDSARIHAKNIIQTEYDWISKKIPELSKPQKLAVCLFIYNFGRTFFINCDLYKIIVSGKDPTDEWLKYCYYTDPRSGKLVKSNNLIEARKRELTLYKNNIQSILIELPDLQSNTILQYNKTKSI